MSLRRALAAWPDDRESLAAARSVVTFLDRHKNEGFDAARIRGATGLSRVVVERLLSTLVEAIVIDCDGDARYDECTYVPDGVLEIEVRRFLKSSTGVQTGTRDRIDRYRNRFGSDH